MIALIQRVTRAQVHIHRVCVGEIGAGVLALIGVTREDTAAAADRLLERLLSYRVFADAAGKMNLSVREVRGGVLLVPQFTLAADTRKGTRAGFSTAAEPARARELFALPARAGTGRLCPCFRRRIWRRHAGVPGQRRAGDLLAVHLRGALSVTRVPDSAELVGFQGSI